MNKAVYLVVAKDSDLINNCIYADFAYPKISKFQYDLVDTPLTLYKCVFENMDDYDIKRLDTAMFHRDSDWILANCDEDIDLITF